MTSVAPQTEYSADHSTQDNEAEDDQRRPRRRKRRPVPTALRRGAYCQTFAALLWLLQAGLIAYVIGLLANNNFTDDIYYAAAAVFALGCVRVWLDGAGAAMAYDAARSELSALRKRAIIALSSRSPLDITRPSSGEAASILAEQAEMVVPYLSRFVPVRVRVMLVPLAILFAVLWFSWAAALVLLIAAPLIPIFMALIGMRAKAASEKQLVALGGMNGFLLDRLRGLATIRTFHAVDATANRLRDNAETLRARTMHVLRIAFLSSAVLELFAALGVAMVAVYIGFHLLGTLQFGAWGQKLTLGEGLFILLLSPAFFEPLRDLSAVWHDRASGEAAIDALEKLSDIPMPIVYEQEQGTVANPVHKTSTSACVAMRNVSFQYPGGSEILTGFDLDCAAGEHIALLAPSGYGKSTILALIAGLVAAQNGSVQIGNVDMVPENAQRLRQRMNWLGQRPHIFAGSARHNITLGREATATALDKIIDDMALSHVAGVTGRGTIGENGAGLSGGEALRLALARIAIAPHADILLADEPTAHLDSATASRIADTLLQFAKGKTLIVATHDEAFASRMDRVVRLDLIRNGEPDWQKRAAE